MAGATVMAGPWAPPSRHPAGRAVRWSLQLPDTDAADARVLGTRDDVFTIADTLARQGVTVHVYRRTDWDRPWMLAHICRGEVLR